MHFCDFISQQNCTICLAQSDTNNQDDGDGDVDGDGDGDGDEDTDGNESDEADANELSALAGVASCSDGESKQQADEGNGEESEETRKITRASACIQLRASSGIQKKQKKHK